MHNLVKFHEISILNHLRKNIVYAVKVATITTLYSIYKNEYSTGITLYFIYKSRFFHRMQFE